MQLVLSGDSEATTFLNIYGNWAFKDGTWSFGNDKRIECEACGYSMYMLIDRLGDKFTKATVQNEMKMVCSKEKSNGSLKVVANTSRRRMVLNCKRYYEVD